MLSSYWTILVEIEGQMFAVGRFDTRRRANECAHQLRARGYRVRTTTRLLNNLLDLKTLAAKAKDAS